MAERQGRPGDDERRGETTERRGEIRRGDRVKFRQGIARSGRRRRWKKDRNGLPSPQLSDGPQLDNVDRTSSNASNGPPTPPSSCSLHQDPHVKSSAGMLFVLAYTAYPIATGTVLTPERIALSERNRGLELEKQSSSGPGSGRASGPITCTHLSPYPYPPRDISAMPFPHDARRSPRTLCHPRHLPHSRTNH